MTGAAAAVPGLPVPLTPLTLPSGGYVVGPPDTLASIAAATGATVSQVGAAAADVTGLLFAGVGFPLPALPYRRRQRRGPGRRGEPGRDRRPVRHDAGRPGGRRERRHAAAASWAPVGFGLTVQTRPGESLGELAARFGLDAADLAAAIADQPGLLAPGATLTVNARPRPATSSSDGDTLASIAAALRHHAAGVTAANPEISCQPGQPCWTPGPAASCPRPGMGLSAPVGLRIVLPHDLTLPGQQPGRARRRRGPVRPRAGDLALRSTPTPARARRSPWCSRRSPTRRRRRHPGDDRGPVRAHGRAAGAGQPAVASAR